MTNSSVFDNSERFIIADYTAAPPFASFLPGIAGANGVPMWVFYVNRAQGIAGFGVESKDAPIMEYQPANKAYRDVATTGFRTFLKIKHGVTVAHHQPFAPSDTNSRLRRAMHIGMNELEMQEIAPAHNLQTSIRYFTLTGEPFAGLVRQVTLTNVGPNPLDVEVIDGMPAVIPYGVNNWGLKEMSRTLEAWMEVFNLEQRIPFYRVRASFGDSVEVAGVRAGHFYLCFCEDGQPLAPIVDPEIVFGEDTALRHPTRFLDQSAASLAQKPQVPVGKTPCGFFGTTATLQPEVDFNLYAIIGHAPSVDVVNQVRDRIATASYIQEKRAEANELCQTLTDTVAIKTGNARLDGYTRQTFLDNVMRGGWPVLLGNEKTPYVYHIFSRKHGDMERDYNHFFLAAEQFSQGNGNYRDVNQNRREDVWLNPGVKQFNIVTFMNLLQADGYNPLVIHGSQFFIPAAKTKTVLALVDGEAAQLAALETFMAQPFTPGGLLKYLDTNQLTVRVPPRTFINYALQHAEQRLQASFGEGYWIDHWTYNLDLIENFLAIYPDQQEHLLFEDPSFTFYDSPAIVRPRSEKYLLVDGLPRQLDAVVVDPEKEALIAAREDRPHTVRTKNGRGQVYWTTLMTKLVCLATVKFATLDPFGMGIEMEANKPGWYDAVNGLPGLFASSMPETFELLRLIQFMREAIAGKTTGTMNLPVEIDVLLQAIVRALNAHVRSKATDRDFVYWDTVTTAREGYRARVRLGFDGEDMAMCFTELDGFLNLFAGKLQAGIARAQKLNNGIPPTYFSYTVDEYEVWDNGDEQGRTPMRALKFTGRVLPLFLEGPARLLKMTADPDTAKDLYNNVRASDLFDAKLKMYRLNASLEEQPIDIGRARAFTPGWLENGSIWTHMAYKYLLATLDAGLIDQFYDDFRNGGIPFQDQDLYGRSPLENVSFIVSSVHPDPLLHGRGFVARLSGATAEYLTILHRIMFGKRPFYMQDDALCLTFQPALPGWLFDDEGKISATFLGTCTITYHNPQKRNTYGENAATPQIITLTHESGETVAIEGTTIGAPHAEQVRSGAITHIDIHLQ